MTRAERHLRRVSSAGVLLLGIASIPAANAGAQTYNYEILHKFSAEIVIGRVDGSHPTAAVIRDPAGNLYGTTSFGGGKANAGTVYEVDTAGHETVLHSFAAGADGFGPQAGVALDSAGNIYGATAYGGLYSGSSGSGDGVVFKLDTAGEETVLHTFTGGADGSIPYGNLFRDPAGNLYGTTLGAGASDGGVVYKIDTAGTETILYSFTGADGASPWAGVIGDAAGNLYGTASTGGAATGCGVVFELEAGGRESVIYAFSGGADGCVPYAGVVRDSAGNLYGTTANGGANGEGVIYKVDTAGQETVLHSFTGEADGGSPNGVTLDPAGNLYGTTYDGGSHNCGVVFEMDAGGNYRVLHNFTGGPADGRYPTAGVIVDSAGSLYGTTFYGGLEDNGVVYRLVRVR